MVADMLPEVGYWVPGILSAWLYRTDSKIAFMEEMASDPDATKEQRHEASLLVQDAIAEHARSVGYRYLLGFTSHQTLIDRYEGERGCKSTARLYSMVTKVLA